MHYLHEDSGLGLQFSNVYIGNLETHHKDAHIGTFSCDLIQMEKP